MFGSRRSDTLARSRWAAIGAAVAVSLGAGGAGWVAHAASTPTRPSLFVAITPCRLIDTHASSGPSFGRHTPLGPAETYTMTARGTHGKCTLPTSAVSVVMNLTIDNPTTASFLTVYPGAVARPKTVSLRWAAQQTVSTTAVTVALSGIGTMNLYNAFGKANVVADVVGYYQSDVVAGGARASGSVTDLGVLPTFILVGAKNTLSVTQTSTGRFCLEFPPSIDSNTVKLTVTIDGTVSGSGSGGTGFAHAEIGTTCGTNGMQVRTYRVDLTTGILTLQAEAFVYIVA